MSLGHLNTLINYFFTMESLYPILQIAAGIVAIGAFIPYVYDIVWRNVRPNRASWAVLALNGTILFFSYQTEAGAHGATWLAAAYAVGPAIIFLLSLWKGSGGTSKFDITCASAALVGLVLWQLTQVPLIAIFMSIVIDFFALLPTLRGVWNGLPESLSAWSIALGGSLLAVVGLDVWNLSTALYPLYVVLWNSSLITLILRQKKLEKQALKESRPPLL